MSTKNGCLALFAAALVFSCGDDDEQVTYDARVPDAPVTVTRDAPPGPTFDAPPAITNVDVTEDLTASTTWNKNTVYHLKQKAGDNKYIFVLPPAKLTVQAGTRIVGAEGTALVIARGAQIEAIGTAAEPIVFSHDAPAGSREPGKFGGLLILGSAKTNLAGNNTKFEAFPDSIGDVGRFGGDNDDDNSGTLRYVRIEFAGFSYLPTREFNGLTLCGVGRGTSIDHVQIHKGNDDGIEFFGGTVNVKHLVLSQNDDDGFDTDNGYTGKAQFVVIQHVTAASSDPNGIEADNHAAPDTNFNNLPRSEPHLYNVTMIGNKATAAHFGAVLRRGTGFKIYNGIITSFASAAAEVRDAATVAVVAAGGLKIENSIIFGNRADNSNWNTAQVDYDEAANFPTAPGYRDVDPMLEDAVSLTAPNFKPKAASPALNGGTAAKEGDGPFIESVTYVGAMGETDWTQGWTAYPQN